MTITTSLFKCITGQRIPDCGTGRLIPGAQQAVSCTLCEDNFNRGDTSDISMGSDCGWTKELNPSNSAISTNRLRFSGVGIVSSDTEQSGTDAFKVTATFQASDTGGVARIIFNWVDTDNYDAVEIILGGLGAGEFRILERQTAIENSVVAQTGLNLFPGGDLTVELCYFTDEDSGRAVATLSTAVGRIWTLVHVASAQVNGAVGLGTTNVATGTIDFDDFVFEQHRTSLAGCPDCVVDECEDCIDKAGPTQIQVTLTGATPGALNGTYVVSIDQADGDECLYSIDDGTNIMTVTISGFGDITVTLTESPAATNSITWIDVLGADIDCLNMSQRDIPFSVDAGTWDGSASTLTLTSL